MSVCPALEESVCFPDDEKKEEKFYLLDFVLIVLNKILTNVLVSLIRVYRLVISPFIGSNCRFDPTCSLYGIEALKVHGPIKGMVLIFKRVIKCHPFNKGGIDPVIK